MAVELAGGLGAVTLFAVPGYALTELLPPLRRMPVTARAAYGYLLGVGVVSGTLYAGSHVAGLPLRAPAIWTAAALPALAGAVAAVVRRVRARRAGPVPPHVREAAAPAEGGQPVAGFAWPRLAGGIVQAACLLVAAAVCCGLLAEAVSDPVHDWDGRMTWTIQARYVRAEATVDAEALRNGRWYVSHPQYPLLLPIAQAAALELLGADLDSHLQRAIYAAFLPVLLLLVYQGARRDAGRTAAALVAAAAAGAPYFAFGEGGAFSTYSDLPLACFYGGAVLLLLAPRPEFAGCLAAGLLLAAAALTKNEGALLAPLALVLGWRSGAGGGLDAGPDSNAGQQVETPGAARDPGPGSFVEAPTAGGGPAGTPPPRAHRRAVLRLAAAALPLLLALALLASWRAGIPDRQDENYPELVRTVRLWPGVVTHVAQFAPVLWRQMSRPHHWAGFWWMAPVVLVAGRGALRHPRNRRLLIAAAGPPAVAWAAYSVHTNPGFLAAVTWERFLLQGSVPLLVLLAGALGEVGRDLRGWRGRLWQAAPAAAARSRIGTNANRHGRN
jgi:hypothetical protein